MSRDLQVRTASTNDLEWVYKLRLRVYAEELGQHPADSSGRLRDSLDGENTYIVAAEGTDPIGFVSLTPPWVGRYGLDKYLTRSEMPALDEAHRSFLVSPRTLSVDMTTSLVSTSDLASRTAWITRHTTFRPELH